MRSFPSVFLSAVGILALAAGIFAFTQRPELQSGPVESDERTVDSYDKIEVGGNFSVEVNKGPQSAIRLEGKNLDNVVLKVKNNTLYIGYDKNNWGSQHVEVRMTVPELYAISLAGSGEIVADGPFGNGQKLELDLAGSGNMLVEVDASKLSAGIAGSGSITCIGRAGVADIDIAGSGDFRGKELLANEALVSIAGSGGARVHASESILVEVAGSGSVDVYGNPSKVKKDIAGSGDLTLH